MRLWRRGLREFSVRKGFGLESVFTVFCLLFSFCGALRPQETIRLIRDKGAQDGCLDFLTALEL